MAAVIRILLHAHNPQEAMTSGRRRLPVRRVRKLVVSIVVMQTRVRANITAAAPVEEKPAKSSRNFLPKTVWMMKYVQNVMLPHRMTSQLNGLRMAKQYGFSEKGVFTGGGRET